MAPGTISQCCFFLAVEDLPETVEVVLHGVPTEVLCFHRDSLLVDSRIFHLCKGSGFWIASKVGMLPKET